MARKVTPRKAKAGTAPATRIKTRAHSKLPDVRKYPRDRYTKDGRQ